MALTTDTITQVSDKALAGLCRQNRTQFTEIFRRYQKRQIERENMDEAIEQMNRLNNEYDVILREIGRRWMEQQGA
jgi:hypothetical protein